MLTLYLVEAASLELRPKILAELRPGARVVSHDSGMGDWEPDAKIELPVRGEAPGPKKSSTLYYWVVPARLEGRWRTQVPLGSGVAEVTLDFTQRYQSLGGAATVAGAKAELERGRVSGQLVFFRFAYQGGALRFEGRLRSDRIVGRVTAADARSHPWRALRVKEGG